MLIFLDTEFTQLDYTAKLISIAIVDENENTFYVELNDTYKKEDCSQFVYEHVLPHLLGSSVEISYNEACARMAQWIEDRGVSCKFATDAPHWDIRLIDPMLENNYPTNLLQDIYLVDINVNKQKQLFEMYNFVPHFALHDALVNKRATIV